jgi:hypothetical protein
VPGIVAPGLADPRPAVDHLAGVAPFGILPGQQINVADQPPWSDVDAGYRRAIRHLAAPSR